LEKNISFQEQQRRIDTIRNLRKRGILGRVSKTTNMELEQRKAEEMKS
jgi:hypothetical protein